VHTFEDAGISGAKGRDQRPGFDAMMKAATRREFDLIAAWSVDRLGRSLQHLVHFLADLQSLGIDLYLHQQHVDRVNAGLARAKANGKVLGRPKVKPAVEQRIRHLRAQGMGMLKIGRTLGVGTGTVQRVVGSGVRARRRA
jgi:DNA invertase Pin-like site-specific DNA recombinase